MINRPVDAELLTAVRQNKLAEVISLLERGASPSATDPYDDNSCLNIAAFNNQPEIIDALLVRGACISARNKDDKTPVETAAEKQHWSCVIKIATYGVNVNEKDPAHFSQALLLAAEAGQLEAVNALLAAGASAKTASLNVKTYSQTAIERAACNHHWPCVLAIANSRDTDEADSAHYGSALLVAVDDNHSDSVKALLTKKASKIWHEIATENGCLHTAVIRNHPEHISLLIQQEHNLKKTNKEGKTPMRLAVDLGHWKCVTAIGREKKLKRDEVKDYSYDYAFTKAVEAGEYEAAEALSDSIGKKSIDMSHLQTAVIKNDHRMIALLLNVYARCKKSPDINKAFKTAFKLHCWKSAQVLDPKELQIRRAELFAYANPRLADKDRCERQSALEAAAIFCACAKPKDADSVRILAESGSTQAYLWLGNYHQQTALLCRSEAEQRKQLDAMVYCYGKAAEQNDTDALSFLEAHYTATNNREAFVAWLLNNLANPKSPLSADLVSAKITPADAVKNKELIYKLQCIRGQDDSLVKKKLLAMLPASAEPSFLKHLSVFPPAASSSSSKIDETRPLLPGPNPFDGR